MARPNVCIETSHPLDWLRECDLDDVSAMNQYLLLAAALAVALVAEAPGSPGAVRSRPAHALKASIGFPQDFRACDQCTVCLLCVRRGKMRC